MDDGAGVPSRTTGEGPALVDLASIEAAATSLPDGIRDSPAVYWDDGTWLKLENLQPTGSFKIRGALTKISRIPLARRTAGVVAYSSGNHGIAVARAARMCGTTATVVVPEDAPRQKVSAIAREGAKVVSSAPGSEQRRLIAEAIAAESGQVLVPPYNDPDVIAGQGTIGIELLRQVPHLLSVVVPVGGGGLISGIAAAVKALRPSVKVIGVEPELAGDARQALATGRLVQWSAEEVGQTIADGIRTQSLGALNFAHVIRLVDDIVTVSDDDILDTAALLLHRRRIIAEPTGAVSLAAVVTGKVAADGAAVVISGANASAGVLQDLAVRAERFENSPGQSVPRQGAYA
ncbi:MAG TPA: threonine/serine dehydratase [Streptosporangiaceae bacterium]|nr:threonine/serine dehydratase [Streptosporangiaceae bacterium]